MKPFRQPSTIEEAQAAGTPVRQRPRRITATSREPKLAAAHLREAVLNLTGRDTPVDVDAAIYDVREALFALGEDSYFDETPERQAAALAENPKGMRRP